MSYTPWTNGEAVTHTALNQRNDELMDTMNSLAGFFELQSPSILTGTATSMSLTSIVQSKYELVIYTLLRTDRAANYTDDVLLTFNSSGAGYSFYSQIFDATGAASADTATGQAFLRIPRLATAVSAFANTFAFLEIHIPDYASNSRAKHAYWTGAALGGTGGANQNAAVMGSGLWDNTNPITRVDIAPANGPNFIAGCQISLFATGSALS